MTAITTAFVMSAASSLQPIVTATKSKPASQQFKTGQGRVIARDGDGFAGGWDV
jgi:hypothetical protein